MSAPSETYSELSVFHLACGPGARVENRSLNFSDKRPFEFRCAASIKLYRCRNLERVSCTSATYAIESTKHDESGLVDCCESFSVESNRRGAKARLRLAVFVPPSLTRKFIEVVISYGKNDDMTTSKLDEAEWELRKSIHSCLLSDQTSSQLRVCEVISSYGALDPNFPADVVLMAIPENKKAKTSNHTISELCNLLNHETFSGAPWAVIKAFPVSSVRIYDPPRADGIDERLRGLAELPCCPVCLDLIDPIYLGLPGLEDGRKCSQWCRLDGFSLDDADASSLHYCVNESKLIPWPAPSHCAACKVINGNAKPTDSSTSLELSPPRGSSLADMLSTNKCHQCEMTSTLWVCLTCGYVGCGRYTKKHAAQHFKEKSHPYSLELATGRIWDYSNGKFVHRKDLFDCPVFSLRWGFGNAPESYASQSQYQDHGDVRGCANKDTLAGSCGEDVNASSCSSSIGHRAPSKLIEEPKKSIMISEEYEVLLQSALEDQAQHYEGKISHLKAELVSIRLDRQRKITDIETQEIQELQDAIQFAEEEVRTLSATLLDAQTVEANHRSTSQKLLREQTISKELLEKIRHETRQEHETCKLRMEDLEGQIEDLTANLRVMAQLQQNEELSQGQILGTAGGEQPTRKQRGKKNRRGKKR